MCKAGLVVKLRVGEHELIFDDGTDLVGYMTGYTISIMRAKKTFYAKRWNGKVLMYLHREIMGLSVGDPREVDHENGNGLDFRRENLRICTGSQNNAAKGYDQEFCTSKYRGVRHSGKNYLTKPWFASIGVNGKPIYLGYFATPEEAALAYNQAAYAQYGSFARLNQVPLNEVISVI